MWTWNTWSATIFYLLLFFAFLAVAAVLDYFFGSGKRRRAAHKPST